MDRPDSIWSVDHATRERDYTYLCKLIGDPDLPPDVRAHLAKIILALLTKKIQFPAHRLAKSKTFMDQIAIGSRIQDLKRQGAKKPFETVAVEFGCSVRKVQGCWAVYRDFSRELQAEKYRDDYERDMAHEAHRAAAVQSLKDEHGDRDFSEEEIEAAEQELAEAWASKRYDC